MIKLGGLRLANPHRVNIISAVGGGQSPPRPPYSDRNVWSCFLYQIYHNFAFLLCAPTFKNPSLNLSLYPISTVYPIIPVTNIISTIICYDYIMSSHISSHKCIESFQGVYQTAQISILINDIQFQTD